MKLRLDRFATLSLVSPLMRLASEKRPSIPILMYHSVAEDADWHLHPYYRTTTAPEAFAAQMAFLYRNGYRTCSISQVAEFLSNTTEDWDKKVAITFDDGYRDFYSNAFPLLSRFGFTATVYLPTSYIGENTLQFKGRDCLTWSEIRELQSYGISFGSHTVTHPHLITLSKNTIETEIVNSKNEIEDKTGCVVDSFAYPYAFPQTRTEFRAMLRESLCRAGYRNGVCTIVGRAEGGGDPFFMERLPVNTCDDNALFKAKLDGAYDWISKTQFLAKTAKDNAARIAGFVKRTPGRSSVEI